MTARTEEQRTAIRRSLGWIVVATLCIAALTAIVALLTGEFDDDDWRVIGASLGFGVFSALAAPGATLRLRASERLQLLGLATLVLAAVSYLLMLGGLFIAEDDEATWQWFGVFALGAFSSSHAALILGSTRDTDSQAVRVIALASILFSVLDSGIGILAIAGAFDDIDDPEGFARVIGVLVVLLLLTTALPPVMRRLQTQPPPGAPVRAAEPGPAAERAPAAPFAAEVIASVDRIAALNADPGNNAPAIRRECERLRELARMHSR